MPDSPLNVALVGPGRMGSVYARLASELSETKLIAVCGRSEGSTRAVSEQYNVPGYPNARHEEMLANHPEIEAVVIAPSEWMHTSPVLAALEAGKHVLVEKPMAVSLADAQAMVDTADRVGVHFMVCHSLRFDHPYATMRAAVAAGEIGEVMHLYSRRNTIQFAAERVLGKFSLAYWLTPHDIDMMLWTVGRPIVEVKAYSREQARGRHDFIIGVYTFDNGVIGVHETSWSTPAFSGRPQSEHFSIHGTRGAAEVLGHEHAVAIYHVDGQPDYPDLGYTPVLHGRQEGMFRSLFSHFVGVVQENWTPVVTARDGLAAIRVADALERALESGKTETVSY